MRKGRDVFHNIILLFPLPRRRRHQGIRRQWEMPTDGNGDDECRELDDAHYYNFAYSCCGERVNLMKHFSHSIIGKQ